MITNQLQYLREEIDRAENECDYSGCVHLLVSTLQDWKAIITDLLEELDANAEVDI